MKKLKSLIKKLFSICFALTMVVVTGCKTVPSTTIVHPLSLLDNQSGFYLSAPSNADPELVKRIIINNVKNISDKDAGLIAENIDCVYAGINHTKTETSVQVSVDANIPSKYVKKILTKKNGWKNEAYAPNGSSSPYTIYSPVNNEELEMTFPSDKIACLGRDVRKMTETYDSIHQIPAEESIGQEYYSIDSKVYEYLRDADKEIRFYAVKPQSFLTILTGANLDLKLIDVSGSFYSDPDYDKQYLLDLHFHFKNNKFLKAGKTLLTLAFGLTSVQGEDIDDNALTIKGIHIDKEQLYKLLII